MLESTYKSLMEAGCDEAGRGCLAGPVVAAAVILPEDFNAPGLHDSKKLSEKKRNELRTIIEQETIWAVASCSPEEIDEMNILNASFEAMHRAIKKLSQTPELLLIDGNRFIPFDGIDHECFIKGDGRYMSIAAASILAKTHRDEIMYSLHKEHPEYGWERNKGYPTKDHRQAIDAIGLTPFHRKTFGNCKQLSLSF